MTVINDLYRLLFGREGTNKGTDIDMSEHGRVGGLSTGQPFKFISIIDPSSGQSPSVTDGKLDVNATVGGGTQYTDGDSTPANPTGNITVFDNSGTITAVSDTNPLPVTGTFYQATQPVSAASLPLPTGASTEATLLLLLTEIYINNGSMAMQVDDTGTTLYQGWAEPGTATSSAGWRIRKVVSSGTPTDTSITWADGDRNFNNIWDNRAALSYS